MICECYKCEARTSCEVLVKGSRPEEFQYQNEDIDGYQLDIYALQCHVCGTVFFAEEDPGESGIAYRVYPEGERFVSYSLPPKVRESLAEAIGCYKAKVYNACAVMCGRVLEAICKEHGITKDALGGGLTELKNKGVIDSRMYDWSNMLRKQRNIGAHSVEKSINKEDAKELLEFTEAIVNYIFVLNDKYNQFIDRQKAKEMQPEKQASP